ncbi:MAG: EAL domain-containing protein [Mariprofundales bacterium]
MSENNNKQDCDENLRFEQVQLLYRHFPLVLSSHLVLLVVVLGLLWNDINTSLLLLWCFINLCVIMARFWLRRCWLKNDAENKLSLDLDVWLKRFIIGIIGSGLVWGSIAALALLLQANITAQILVLLIIIGLAAGALNTSAYISSVFLAFIIPLFIPCVITFIWRNAHDDMFLLAIFLFYALALLITLRHNSKEWLESICLRLHSQNLEARLHALIDASPDLICLRDAAGRWQQANSAQLDFFGIDKDNYLNKTDRELDCLRNKEHKVPMDAFNIKPSHKTAKQNHWRGERHVHTENDECIFDVSHVPIMLDNKESVGSLYIAHDISSLVKIENIEALRARVLEKVAHGAPVKKSLHILALSMEQSCSDWHVSILLLDKDKKYLHHGVAPSLPEHYNNLVDGLEIGKNIGSCGSAAFLHKPIFIADIHKHENWNIAEFCTAAASIGMNACWSQPIFSHNNKLLGTFAVYLTEIGMPTIEQQSLLRNAAHLAGIAIARELSDQQLRLGSTVFQCSAEGMMVTDINANIVAINKAFTIITGYSEAEVIGNKPDILKSGRHDKSFYTSLWQHLHDVGMWQGEVWNRRKNGEIFAEWLTISSVLDDNDKVLQYVGIFSDITELKVSQEKLDHLAHHDPLTQLPNRLLLHARLKHALARAHQEQHQVAVLFIDLDRFKNVNDSLGHPIGDVLLQKCAQRLLQCVTEEDTIARLGGDEFIVVLECVNDSQIAATTARSMIELMAKPFHIEKHVMVIGASIGISLYPDDGYDVTQLLKNADTAMYRAKDGGRNAYHFYTEELTVDAVERFALENSLRQALVNDEFELYFQPMLSLNTHDIVTAEALVRWRHPEQGIILPDRFIPLAEETGLIESLGEWVLRAACIQAKQWQDQDLPAFNISVNLSARQLGGTNLVNIVLNILKETGLPPSSLELEITETSIIMHAEQALQNLKELRKLGITLSIDDFGTGYSSMDYLKRFSVHKLKIDQSFVRDIPGDRSNEAIVQAMIALGHSLNLTVIAEGVETHQQRQFLKKHDCDEMQGFLLSKPVEADTFSKLLSQHNSDWHLADK